jgi:transcription initiation factor TFIIIB Brf1 subunit/transcription initiation factor TFIIB
MLLKCDECQSENIRSDEHGFYLCYDCGLVLELPVILNNAPKMITSKVNGKVETHYSPFIIGTSVGKKSERTKKFDRLNSLQNQTFSTAGGQAHQVFTHLSSEFDIKINIPAFITIFKKLYKAVPARSVARNVQNLCIIIFIKKCHLNLINIEPRKILTLFNLDISHYHRIIDLINRVDIPEMRRQIESIPEYSKLFISNLNEYFHLTPQVCQLAKELVDRCQIHLGQTPRIIAGAAVVLALNNISPKSEIKIYKIAKFLGVSASTIYQRYNSFPIKIKIRNPIHPVATALKSPVNLTSIKQVTVAHRIVGDVGIKSLNSTHAIQKIIPINESRKALNVSNEILTLESNLDTSSTEISTSFQTPETPMQIVASKSVLGKKIGFRDLFKTQQVSKATILQLGSFLKKSWLNNSGSLGFTRKLSIGLSPPSIKGNFTIDFSPGGVDEINNMIFGTGFG